MKLISQGAEAKIYLIESPCKSVVKLSEKFILKQRTLKSYRHPQLDNQIRTRRTRSEAKILTKAISVGVNVPKVTTPTGERRKAKGDKFEIYLEFINGDRLSETLNSYPEKKQFQIMQQLGKQVALLHENNIIHADLTTSNIILANGEQRMANGPQSADLTTSNIILANGEQRMANGPQSADLTTSNIILANGEQRMANDKRQTKVFLIDFGLSFVSTKIEDKAVDIHLIKQALEAKHFRSPDHLRGQNHQQLFKNFLKTYDNKEVIERLKIVEKRGRYKH